MIRARSNYILFLALLAAGLVVRVFPAAPLVVIQILGVLVFAAIGVIVFQIRTGLTVTGDPQARGYLESQMSILILLVVAGIVAAFQLLVRFGGHGDWLHRALLLLNWGLYCWGVAWIVRGTWRCVVEMRRAGQHDSEAGTTGDTDSADS